MSFLVNSSDSSNPYINEATRAFVEAVGSIIERRHTTKHSPQSIRLKTAYANLQKVCQQTAEIVPWLVKLTDSRTYPTNTVIQ